MYETFFGLRELPFRLAPNPRFLVETPRHREALSNLSYAIKARNGISLLLGEAGTGKTTLLKATLQSQREQSVLCGYLNNPALTRDEFVESVGRVFDLTPGAQRSKSMMLLELHRLLNRRHAMNGSTLLLIDEAQSMSAEILEEVRLLANLDQDGEQLLSIVLAGQPEMAERLNQVEFRQLKQRVALRCSLTALTGAETRHYIATRITLAGGRPEQMFTREAIALIYERSRGIPRTISVICDNALINGLALQRKPVGRDVVLDVCVDFDLRAPQIGELLALEFEPETAPEPQAGPEPERAPAREHEPEREPVVAGVTSSPGPAAQAQPAAKPAASPTMSPSAGAPPSTTLPPPTPAPPPVRSPEEPVDGLFTSFGKKRFSWF